MFNWKRPKCAVCKGRRHTNVVLVGNHSIGVEVYNKYGVTVTEVSLVRVCPTCYYLLHLDQLRKNRIKRLELEEGLTNAK